MPGTAAKKPVEPDLFDGLPVPVASSIIRVAVPANVRQSFDYRIDDDRVAIGSRVKIPFARQGVVTGLVVDTDPATDFPANRMKVAELIDESALVDADTVRLAAWATAYYLGTPGDMIDLLLPPALRQGKMPRIRTTKRWRAVDNALECVAKGAKKQLALLELITKAPGGLVDSEINERLQGWRPAAKALLERCVLLRDEVEADSLIRGNGSRRVDLADEQVLAIDWITESFGTAVTFLLHGITGSGKTEVYIEAAREAISKGKQALILVPEIGLTPQTIRRFADSLDAPIAVLHSRMAETERAEHWLAASTGKARVLIGTRSSVLTPLPDLGLICVDEEHDTSFGAQEGLRFSARDLAVMRGHKIKVPVVLGSATPSMETVHNADEGRYRLIKLTSRRGNAKPPTIRMIDLRTTGIGDGGLSPRAWGVIGDALKRGEQCLIFRNKRGFSRALHCGGCGWVCECPRCDVPMTLHRSGRGRMVCHHCGTQKPEPVRCEHCGSEGDLKPVGEGTQQLEQALAKRFPGERVLRIDRDAQRTQQALEAALELAREGSQARIMVATELLSKGHDLPHLTTVVVVGADGGLLSGDFRGPERLSQQILQVAGRAGRRSKPGMVYVQTFYPDHPLYAALGDGWHAIAKAALDERRSASLPPFSHHVMLRARSSTEAGAMQFLQRLAETMSPPDEIRVMGPIPATIERIDGQWRAYLLLESVSRPVLHGFLRAWLAANGNVRSNNTAWAIDVDPMTMD